MDKTALLLAIVLSEAIREAGSVPSGRLYARVMDRMSLEVYDLIIGSLCRSKLVARKNHLLTWIGPRLD